jgi:hypothetical protein
MNPKKKIYTSLATFFTISLLFVVLLIYPFFGGIKEASGELLLQKINLFSHLEEIKTLEISKEFYEINQKNLEKIDEQFVDPEIPIEFIRFLEKNATDSDLSIDIIPTGTIKKDNDLWPGLFFQVSTNGYFSDFLKFLEKLENGPYLLEIVNLNLKKMTEETTKKGISSSFVNAAFSIKVYTRQ